MNIRFHKRPTQGQGIDGATVNALWLDISVNGKKSGYVRRGIDSIWYAVTFGMCGGVGGEFLKLRDAKAYAIRTLETNPTLQENELLDAEVII